jgi:hypothetical protein
VSGAADVWAGRPELGVPLVRRAVELLEYDPDLRDDPRPVTLTFFAVRWLMDPSRTPSAGWPGLGMPARSAFSPPGSTLAAAGVAWLGDHLPC